MNNGSKVIRINIEIAGAIEKLAKFFGVSTAAASIIFFRLDYETTYPLRNIIKKAKIRYVRRKVLQKVQNSRVNL